MSGKKTDRLSLDEFMKSMTYSVIFGTRWTEIPEELRLQIHDLSAPDRAKLFTVLFKSDYFAALMASVAGTSFIVDRTRQFDVGVVLGDDWRICRGSLDTRVLKVAEFDPQTFVFETALESGETLKGHDRLAHLRSGDFLTQYLRVDAKFGQALLEEEGQKLLHASGHPEIEFPGMEFEHLPSKRRYTSGARKRGHHFERHMWALDTDVTSESRPVMLVKLPQE